MFAVCAKAVDEKSCLAAFAEAQATTKTTALIVFAVATTLTLSIALFGGRGPTEMITTSEKRDALSGKISLVAFSVFVILCYIFSFPKECIASLGLFVTFTIPSMISNYLYPYKT